MVGGDEGEEEGSDKGVAPNCYRFSSLNLVLREVRSLRGAGTEVQRGGGLSSGLNSKRAQSNSVLHLSS